MSKKLSTNARSREQFVKEIDRIDRELVKLMNERARAAERLARTADGERADSRDFESQLAAIVGASRGPLAERALQATFRELVSGCRSLIRPIRVAYLGPLYSYSYLATIERFGSSAELASVATIAAVLEEVNRGHADFGVVPL